MVDLLLFSAPTWLVALLAFGWPLAALLVAFPLGRIIARNDERIIARDEARLLDLAEQGRRDTQARAEEFDGVTFVWPGDRAFAERSMDADGLGSL